MASPALWLVRSFDDAGSQLRYVEMAPTSKRRVSWRFLTFAFFRLDTTKSWWFHQVDDFTKLMKIFAKVELDETVAKFRILRQECWPCTQAELDTGLFVQIMAPARGRTRQEVGVTPRCGCRFAIGALVVVQKFSMRMPVFTENNWRSKKILWCFLFFYKQK